MADKKKHRVEMLVTPPLRGIFSEKANRPPRLKPIFGEIKNRRLRLIRPDMEVTVRARAMDPDGDALRYKWIIDRDAGTIDNVSKPVVTWKSGRAGKLHLFVIDRRGAYAHLYLPISKSKGVLFAGQVISNRLLGIKVNDLTVKKQHF